MDQIKISQLAQRLNEARLSIQEIDSLFHSTEGDGGFSLEEAYAIQAEGIRLREKAGDPILGFKMGLTSLAKMKQMNLHTPIYGVLTESMWVQKKDFDFSKLIHPKIEPEIAFYTSREISRPLQLNECLDYISDLCPALEILDSRFRGFKYFTLEDVVADNASSSHFYLGEKISTKNFPHLLEILPTLSLSFKENEELKHEERLSAILDHPLHSLMELSQLFSKEGRKIPAQSLILAGAVTQALPLVKNHTYSNTIQNIGEAKLKTVCF